MPEAMQERESTRKKKKKDPRWRHDLIMAFAWNLAGHYSSQAWSEYKQLLEQHHDSRSVRVVMIPVQENVSTI